MPKLLEPVQNKIFLPKRRSGSWLLDTPQVPSGSPLLAGQMPRPAAYLSLGAGPHLSVDHQGWVFTDPERRQTDWAMQTLDLDQFLALLSVVVAVTVLSPAGAAIVLAFALGLVCNVKRRAD